MSARRRDSRSGSGNPGSLRLGAVGLCLILAGMGGGLFGAAPAVAQEGGEPVPLTKSDLTRMLVGTTYTPAEVARIVGRSCLSFEPTARDLQDFRRVGATEDVVGAVEECQRRAAPLTVQLATQVISAQVGNVASVPLQLLQNQEPVAGVRVVLEGSEGIAGAGGQSASAVTDETGRAVLRIPAGSTAARYAMRVAVPGRQVEGGRELVLSVQAPPPPAERANVAAATPAREPDRRATERVERTESPARTEPAAEEFPLEDAPAPTRTARTEPEPETEPAQGGQSDASVARSMGNAALRDGDPAAAAGLFQRATASDPYDAEAWLGLGRAQAASGRYGEARQSLRRAAELDPGLHSQVRTEMARLPVLPPELEGSLWGGASYDDGQVSELLFVELAVRPVDFVRVFGRYDGGLDLDAPALVRGRGSPRAVAGGAALRWGEQDRFTTLFEAGRRESQDGLLQYTYRVEQRVHLSLEPDQPVLEIGAFLGRWWDRDDWLAQARLELPILPEVTVRPGISVGETVGTAFDELGRRPAREVRAELGAFLRPVTGVILMPTLSYGLVDDLELDESGSLAEGRLRIEAPIRGGIHLQGFLRHQRPPFSEAFTSVAAGVRVGVEPLR